MFPWRKAMSTDLTIQTQKDEVLQAELRLAEAHLALDLERIDSLLHRDYVIIQPGGKIETKAEVLASYQTDTRRWARAQSDQMDIRLYENMAVVVGRWRAAGHHGEKRFNYEARFLSIWLKQDGRWQNIAYQSTEIEA
jgi:hypothetical protein